MSHKLKASVVARKLQKSVLAVLDSGAGPNLTKETVYFKAGKSEWL